MDIYNDSNLKNLSASTEDVEFLNKIQYIDNEDEYIFYTDGEDIFAQSDSIIYSMNQSFSGWFLGFENKIQTIRQYLSEMKEVDIDEINEKNNEMYTPNFSLQTPDHKRLKLFNAKGQGSFGMCWAASCATIINYRCGTNYSAKKICDKMKIGYDDGANIDEKQQALKKYGIVYDGKTNSVLSWEKVKSCISKKFPIAISTFGKTSAHALTIFGYQVIGSGRYIVIWDSALGKNGKGTTRLVAYEGKNTTVLVNGEAFAWKKSLYKK